VPFSESQRKQVIAALTEKTAPDPGEPQTGCPMCGRKQFSVGNDLVAFPLQPDAKAFHLGGSSFVCVPVICLTCGATQFFNVYGLGVAEVLGLPAAPSAKKEG
jgi:hypothetical protein